MRGMHLLLAMLTLLGQDDTTETASPETVRVLAIEARQVDGAPRHLDASLSGLGELLEKVPGNQFTEKSYIELEAHFGQETVADLGGGYAFGFTASDVTELGEIEFACHIDLTEGDRTVEALRVTGKAVRGQGAVFRGLTLPQGELVVVMSIARADDPPGRGGSGGSGQERGGAEGGGAGSPGEEGAGDGDTKAPEERPSPLPELPSRQLQVEAEPLGETTERGGTVGVGDAAPPPDMAAIEGILRALEEQDMAEQKNARGRRFEVKMRGDWW